MAEKTTGRHLAETILAAASLGVYGTTLYANQEPATKSDTLPIAVVYDRRGFDPVVSSDDTIRLPTVTIRVIGMAGDAGDVAAAALMEDIYEFMKVSFDTTVDSTRYFGSYGQGDYGHDGYEDERSVYSADFRLYKQKV